MSGNRKSDQISIILKAAEGYENEVIEHTLLAYIHKQTGAQKHALPQEYTRRADQTLLKAFSTCHFACDIEHIIYFFESLLAHQTIVENGVVFTPLYLADYINRMANDKQQLRRDSKVIDPGCGCGIFPVSTVLLLRRKFNSSYEEIFRTNIHGIDIDADNVRRCRLVLRLLPLFEGQPFYEGPLNIRKADSLKTDWNQLFGVECFDFIEGNPPYVNLHDMKAETAQFLREHFTTTRTGVYNIFYAFIEHGMRFLSPAGSLSFIVPNNFLTIKAATDLRHYIAANKYPETVIDFAHNMLFKPVRTYNSIIRLTKGDNRQFQYAVLEKCADIEKALETIHFHTEETETLEKEGWKLVDDVTRENIRKIENQPFSIREMIRTGIATLKDDAYFVESDGSSFYKETNGIRYDIEADLVKPIYKIPELKSHRVLASARRHIIFPYTRRNGRYEIIREAEMQQAYPSAYAYFRAIEHILAKRDKGKINVIPWYAYGRSQGLNKYGSKLLFPTFADAPRFTFADEPDALFCNGYAVFEDGFISPKLLQKILNSFIMNYYISKTSYSIEGGYYCYQKKYIERFTFPSFSNEERNKLISMEGEELDNFLISKYGLNL